MPGWPPTRVAPCRRRRGAGSPWSPSGARATRWTPRSSPAGSWQTAGRWSTTRHGPTWPWSTPAASSKPPRRTPSTPCSRRPTSSPAAPRRWWPSVAWPSATGRPWPRRCPRPTRCSASTPTPRCPAHLQTLLDGGSVAVAPSPRPTPTAARWPSRTTAGASRRGAPGHASGQGDAAGPGPAYRPPATRIVRERLDARPWAPLKIASGCDRRCAFCAIPAFRGSFVSRPPADILAEARLARRAAECARCSSSARTPRPTARTSATQARSRRCCRRSPRVDGIDRVRVSYLQPAEIRPGLLAAMARTEGVAPYYDISFQHASRSAAAPDAPLR